MPKVAIGLAFLAIAFILTFGWIIPLVVGIVKCANHKKHGKHYLAASAVWGLLIAAVIGWSVFKIKHAAQSYYHTFDPAEYDGPTATLTFPYTADGTLWFEMEDSDGDSSYQRADITAGLATLPATNLTLDSIHFNLTNNCRLSITEPAADSAALALAPGATHTLTGGPPFTAAIVIRHHDAEERSLYLDFVMTDSADHQIAIHPRGGNPPQFEAISPDGKCFWRDKFEYG